MSAVSVPTPQPNLWKPVLIRALLSLAFGLVTVFLPDLPGLWRGAVTGIFLVATGACSLLLSQLIKASLPHAHRWLQVQRIVIAVAGILVMIFHESLAYQIILSIGFILAGGIDLLLGFRYRLRTVLGRDWLITGGVLVIAAIILALIGQASYRAPIGVVGGASVVVGVVLVLAALSYRHDAGRPATAVKAP